MRRQAGEVCPCTNEQIHRARLADQDRWRAQHPIPAGISMATQVRRLTARRLTGWADPSVPPMLKPVARAMRARMIPIIWTPMCTGNHHRRTLSALAYRGINTPNGRIARVAAAPQMTWAIKTRSRGVDSCSLAIVSRLYGCWRDLW
jgi:hypothetical protein